MSRLRREQYNEAVGALKRFEYNRNNIIDIRSDILTISSAKTSDTRATTNIISDTVLAKVIELDENKSLKQSAIEYKAVKQALMIASKEAIYIFEDLFKNNMLKWDIMQKRSMSARTFERRKREIIYITYEEIVKIKKV